MKEQAAGSAPVFRRGLLVVGLVILLTGCASSMERPAPVSSSQAADLRNNTYSLLYDLLQDERHLSKLLIIKRESRELKDLVKRISDMAGDGADRLKTMAKTDRSLHLLSVSLPPGEAATRKAIADTKKSLLLGQSGPAFEREVLLTQVEALNYGSHLAGVAAVHDSNRDRASYLSNLSTNFYVLREEALGLLFKAPGRR
jgi:hypothetical protein